MTEAPEATPTGGMRFVRYCFVLLLAGAVLLAWVSLLTFSRTDPPSPAVYPAKEPAANAMGAIGAYLAWMLRYWLGGGVYMALLFASVAAFILVTGGRIGDLPWRAIGLAILVAGTSTAVYLLYPVGPEELPSGSAGVLGMGLGEMLLTKFAPMGAWLLVILALCIGLVSLDSLEYRIKRSNEYREAVNAARKLAEASLKIAAKYNAEEDARDRREKDERRLAIAGLPAAFLAAA